MIASTRTMMERPLLAKASELFNRKQYFECHDLLEDAWTGTRGAERDFLQALIHIAVGMYHVAAGNHKGAMSQLGAGIGALEAFRPEREGLDVDQLLVGAMHCLKKSRQAAEGGSITWVAEDIPRMDYRGLV
jgi:predicted metal-dependent hydrolase